MTRVIDLQFKIDSFQITNCLLQFIFAGAAPLVDYEFYVEGYAREVDEFDILSPFWLNSSDSDTEESSGDDRTILYLSKRDVTSGRDKADEKSVERPVNNETKVGDVESGNTTSKASAIQKRPSTTIVTENEIHQRKMTDDLKKKIAEVQAEPVILTQGV